MEFTYEDAKGKVTERSVIVIKEPTDSYLTIDLTEFSPDERDYYEDEYYLLEKAFQDGLRELGLSQNYRRFKRNRMSDIKWAKYLEDHDVNIGLIDLILAVCEEEYCAGCNEGYDNGYGYHEEYGDL